MNDRLPPTSIPERGQKLDPAGADALPAPTTSTPPPPPPPPSGHRSVVDVRRTVLIEAYWKLRDHAASYRDTNAFRRAQERWESSGRRDDELMHKLSIHVHYARGIEAAAREIAEMLGVPEHEIERTEATDGQ